jgi:hypothetical protein
MKRRYCGMCDELTNANPCPACGADTERWTADGSHTDRYYQEQARTRKHERAEEPKKEG